MKNEVKNIESLQVYDLKTYALWKYANDDDVGETAVVPVRRIPVSKLTGKLVATEIRLANGRLVWALLGNIDAENSRLTKHFLTVSILSDGKWFTLSRYHDFDYATHGPDALARFLRLEINQIFPISYDIAHVLKGNPNVVIGQILKQPEEILTRAEIIALAVP